MNAAGTFCEDPLTRIGVWSSGLETVPGSVDDSSFIERVVRERMLPHVLAGVAANWLPPLPQFNGLNSICQSIHDRTVSAYMEAFGALSFADPRTQVAYDTVSVLAANQRRVPLAPAALTVMVPRRAEATRVLKELGYFQFYLENLHDLAKSPCHEPLELHYMTIPFLRLIRAAELDGSPVKSRFLDNEKHLFVDEERVYVVSVVNVHFDSPLEREELTSSGAISTTILGNRMLVQNPMVVACAMSQAFYRQTVAQRRSSVLAEFFSILSLFKRFGPEFDWSVMLEIAERHALQSALFYVLSYVRIWLPDIVPAWMLERCSPELSAYRCDSGDFMPRFFPTDAVFALEHTRAYAELIRGSTSLARL